MGKKQGDPSASSSSAGDDAPGDEGKQDEGKKVFAVFPSSRWFSEAEVAALVAAAVAEGLLAKADRSFEQQVADLAQINALHCAQ